MAADLRTLNQKVMPTTSEKIDVIISSHIDFMKVMPTAQKTGKKDTETCHYLICNTLEVD